MKKTCVVCNKLFLTKKGATKRTKYCSIKCRSKDYYDKYYDHFLWKEIRKCEVCLESFMPVKVSQVNCSSACTKKKWKLKNPEAVLAQARKDAHRKARRDWVEKTCVECGSSFLPNIHHKKSQVTCSTRCRRRTGNKKTKQKEKEILKNPSIDPKRYHLIVARKKVQDANYQMKKRGCKEGCKKIHLHLKEWLGVLESSKNCCGLCGKEGSEENPLGIDHIIPISRGGDNSVTNIQPAHFSCNASKGNRGY